MKKVISVFLALLMLCSSFTLFASADDSLIDQLGDGLGLDVKIEDPKAYGIVFEGGNASTMYMPATQIVFDGPGYAIVGGDYPVAIGKRFRCWKDEKGKDVFPGDEIYVGTIVYLKADYYTRTTNIQTLDTMVCAIETVIHAMQITLKIIETAIAFRPVEEPEPSPAVTPETP